MHKERVGGQTQAATLTKVEVDPSFRTRNFGRWGLGSLAIQNIVTNVPAFVFLAVMLNLTALTDYIAYNSVLVTAVLAVSTSTFALQFAGTRYVALFSSETERNFLD